MALIQCPDCGMAVSDQAGLCIHCGRPLVPHGLPQALEKRPCALVLIGADFNDAALLPQIQELCGCTEEEAETLRSQTPSPLLRGRTYAECAALLGRFGRKNVVGIFRDEDAEDPSRLNAAAALACTETGRKRPGIRQPLSFWQTVGAIVTAVVLLYVGIMVLGWLFILLTMAQSF